jgi:hypothetical protein
MAPATTPGSTAPNALPGRSPDGAILIDSSLPARMRVRAGLVLATRPASVLNSSLTRRRGPKMVSQVCAAPCVQPCYCTAFAPTSQTWMVQRGDGDEAAVVSEDANEEVRTIVVVPFVFCWWLSAECGRKVSCDASRASCSPAAHCQNASGFTKLGVAVSQTGTTPGASGQRAQIRGSTLNNRPATVQIGVAAQQTGADNLPYGANAFPLGARGLASGAAF